MFQQVKVQLVSLFLGSLAFITALAWNAAVQSYFRIIFTTDTSTARGQLYYAMVITAVSIVVAILLLKVVGSCDLSQKLF